MALSNDIESIQKIRKPVICSKISPRVDGVPITDFLPYVLNGPIHLLLLDILLMGLEVNILYENNMLQDLLQICKFIGDIIM